MCNINIKYYYTISGAKKGKGVKVQIAMLDKMERKKRKEKRKRYLVKLSAFRLFDWSLHCIICERYQF